MLYPNIGIGAACPTRQVHFAGQEVALQFHKRVFGRQLLRWVAKHSTTAQFPRRLHRLIEQPIVDRLGFPGELAIEIEAGHISLVSQASPGQSGDKIRQVVGCQETGLARDDLAVVQLLLKMQVIFPRPTAV